MTDFPPIEDPDFENPYPDEDWQAITDFEYVDHLFLARAKDALTMHRDREAEYLVARPYTCRYRIDGVQKTLSVPQGMLNDLASAPWWGRALVGRVGRHLEAAIVHDFLFVAWQDLDNRGANRRDFRFANELMMAAMISAKVGWLPRNLIWLAITSPVGWWRYVDPNPGTRYVRIPPGFVGAAPLAPSRRSA